MPSEVDGQSTSNNRLLRQQITQARTRTLRTYNLRTIEPVISNYYADLLFTFETTEDANRFIADWNSPVAIGNLREFEALVNERGRATVRALLLPLYVTRQIDRAQLKAVLSARSDRPPTPPRTDNASPEPTEEPPPGSGLSFLNEDHPIIELYTPGAAALTHPRSSPDLRRRLGGRKPPPQDLRVVLQTRHEVERRSLTENVVSNITNMAAERAAQLIAPQLQRNTETINTMQGNLTQVQTDVHNLSARTGRSEDLIFQLWTQVCGNSAPGNAPTPPTTAPPPPGTSAPRNADK
jgi:hypothetical protein